MGEAADDDTKGGGGGSTNRYQAMPSLQSLQQMKSRLHTAFLGRRLMMWSAVATGKELRKISDKLAAYQETTFTQEFTQALIMLARCKFHNTEFHKVVLNNVENKAQLTVTSTPKYVSGNKIWALEVIDEGPLAHPYTCIGRGGEVLKEAREKWYNLLKHLIVVLQLRENFNVVYKAHKEATKKKNVMGKIVIPKTLNTIKYIMNELEELGREDFFRLKKIKELKNKKKKAGHVLEVSEAEPCEHICRIPLLDDIDAQVCHSCSMPKATRPTEAKKCSVKRKESHHTHTDTPFTEYIDNSFDVIAKVMDEETLPDSVKEDLSNFVHNLSILKHKLVQAECEQACKKKISSLYFASNRPSKYKTQPMTSQNVTVSTAITPKQSEITKFEAEQDEGVFEVEYKEVTTIKRTKGADGNIKEETAVVRTTTRKDLSEDLGAKTSFSGRPILSQTEPEVQTTKSQIYSKTSNISTAPRSFVSWCVHAPSKTTKGESSKDKMTTVQRQNAQKGLILLPSEMSNKVVRDVGPSKKPSKKDIKEKKENIKKDRHDDCFKD